MNKKMAIKEKIEYLNIIVELTERLDNMHSNVEEDKKNYTFKWQESKEDWYEDLISACDTKLHAIENLKENLEELAR